MLRMCASACALVESHAALPVCARQVGQPDAAPGAVRGHRPGAARALRAGARPHRVRRRPGRGRGAHERHAAAARGPVGAALRFFSQTRLDGNNRLQAVSLMCDFGRFAPTIIVYGSLGTLISYTPLLQATISQGAMFTVDFMEPNNATYMLLC